MPEELTEEEREIINAGARLMGKRGGSECAARHGKAHYQAMGKQGGAKTKATQEPGYYARIGRQGGLKTAANQGPGYYKELGARGRRRLQELIQKGRDAEGTEE